MNLAFLEFIRSVRASYWFLPSVMLLLAIGLGAALVWLDAGPASSLFDDVSWYQKSKPEGAREVLSTIAGSMITVAGVVFSITIVAISFAANQYGPRILTNFMGDRGNQVTLGTFVATFTYSVVVLRTIHTGDTDFVPQLAVMVAMIMALCSIAVLIYFIHHIPESMHINTVTGRIGRQLIKAIAAEFPVTTEQEQPAQSKDVQGGSRLAAKALFGAPLTMIRADANGYLQFVDERMLVEIGRQYSVVFRLEKSPGEFVYAGQAIASFSESQCRQKICNLARRAWTVGSKRTPEQDFLFLVDELVEIAARALSAGVNDPHTANTCVDWLTAAAAQMAQGEGAPGLRCDCDRQPRLLLAEADFGTQLERSFGQLRPYIAGDLNAASYTLAAIASLGEVCRTIEDRQALIKQIDALEQLASASQQGPSADHLTRACASARASLTVPE